MNSFTLAHLLAENDVNALKSWYKLCAWPKFRRLGCYSMKDQLEGSCVLSKVISLSLPYLSLHFTEVGWRGREMAGPLCHCMPPASVCTALSGARLPRFKSRLHSTTHKLCRYCNLSVPQFPQVWNGDNDSHVPPGMLWGLQSLKVRHVEQGLAHSKLSVNVSSYFCACS